MYRYSENDAIENAFINGCKAREAEEDRDNNPYLAGDMQDAWFEGWDDADAGLNYFGNDMDGDHDSAMASCGWGTDEDYGYYGGDE